MDEFHARDLIDVRSSCDYARTTIQGIALIISFIGPVGFVARPAITIADEAGAFDSLNEMVPE